MKVYKATGDSSFLVEEITEQTEEGFVKVKISRIIPTASDIELFTGMKNSNYPIIPCHMAIGIISDDRPEYELKRGEKVIINPYIILPTERTNVLPMIKTYGINKDGFLTTFFNAPIANIIPFPNDLKEDEAIFSEYVSVALATINSCKIEKGDYIAIIGGSVLSNLIAQLALYYQAIPILIDSDPDRLALADKCGIYYTVNTKKEAPIERVKELTGGSMAEHCILDTTQKATTPNHLFALARQGGDCIITGINTSVVKLETDICLISERQLSVRGVSNGAMEFNSAVNMLAQKQLKVGKFIDKRVKQEEIESFFREIAKSPTKYYCPVIQI